MTIYARIEAGILAEIIAPFIYDGAEVPIAERFHSDIVATLIDITAMTPAPEQGWPYAESSKEFSPPAAPSLADLKAAKIQEMSGECHAVILGGFQSSALGAPYLYPSNTIDQQNLASSVLASVMPALDTGWTTPFWCADASGAWAFRPHTAAQIQKVGIDGKGAILSAMSTNAQLADQVAQATTAAAVSTIVWPQA